MPETTHKLLLSVNKDHKCPGCRNLFCSSGVLKRHIKTVHNDERKHPCPHKQCTYAAKTFSDLNDHKKRHVLKSNIRGPYKKKHSKISTMAQHVSSSFSILQPSPNLLHCFILAHQISCIKSFLSKVSNLLQTENQRCAVLKMQRWKWKCLRRSHLLATISCFACLLARFACLWNIGLIYGLISVFKRSKEDSLIVGQINHFSKIVFSIIWLVCLHRILLICPFCFAVVVIGLVRPRFVG